MKISAVGVVSKNFMKSVKFYTILGFDFPEFVDGEDHLETITKKGDTRLMLDSHELAKKLLEGKEPKASNHSVFAIELESSSKVNELAEKLKSSGFKVTKEPWNAFWGQRYCVVSDPDGYMIDLFAQINN
jgi:uncharacterized glyoxalase superfamily protein PhnB